MKTFTHKQRFVLFSNIALVAPVYLAARYHEWIYFAIISGLLVFSLLFHWFRIVAIHSVPYGILRKLDWLFALSAFGYMFYFIYEHLYGTRASIFYLLLIFVLLLFWYGWKEGDYNTWHPWFHIFAAMISSLVLALAH